MPLDDGIYMIHSVHVPSGHLDFSPVTIPIMPPIYFIVGTNALNLREQWEVTATGNGLYKIRSTTHRRAAWALRGTTIVASEGRTDEFSIEPAGEETYRIHVPNRDEVATLNHAGGEHLHVGPDNGANTQRWKFIPISDEE